MTNKIQGNEDNNTRQERLRIRKELSWIPKEIRYEMSWHTDLPEETKDLFLEMAKNIDKTTRSPRNRR